MYIISYAIVIVACSFSDTNDVVYWSLYVSAWAYIFNSDGQVLNGINGFHTKGSVGTASKRPLCQTRWRLHPIKDLKDVQ